MHTDGALRRSIAAAGAVLLAFGVPACGAAERAPAQQAGHSRLALEPGRDLPFPLRGITTDSVENRDELVRSVADLSSAPTVRIVFQEDASVGDYAAAIDRLRPHAYLMGELLDSEALSGFSVGQVRERAEEFVAAYGDRIDVWEIGNELNGSWTGGSPAEINEKVQAAYDVVEKHGGRTALTLNHWSGPDCYEKSWEPTATYARRMPARLRNGVDFVLLSIYETACSPAQHPSPRQIGDMLVRLGKTFPDAKLGIGEIGAQGKQDGLSKNPGLPEKQRLAERYYGMQHELQQHLGPRFIGGYFWWYYHDDAVPRGRTGSLWPTLNRLLHSL
ncbi:Tat pathway signal sequence [Streptomyces sp. CA-250714]|uniref:Tat pathway signal sequence n=1 Tax=Streptomyces sp. CA-250714 TaxID=3240060 RepID=UPI003D90D661